jgi:hypothetical protein
MFRMQWVVCPACRHGHTFYLAIGATAAPVYGYTCPETGQPAAIGPRGQWEASEHASQGAVVLSPLADGTESPTP